MAGNRRRVYEELRGIVEEVGGEMRFERKGRPPGGAWVVVVGGKAKAFPSNGSGFPAMDRLYVPRVAKPSHWRDYSNELVTDARTTWLRMMR